MGPLVTNGLKLSIISNCFSGDDTRACPGLVGEGLGRGREGISVAVTGGLGRCSDSVTVSGPEVTLAETRTLLSTKRRKNCGESYMTCCRKRS